MPTLSKRDKIAKAVRVTIAENGLLPSEIFPGYGLPDDPPPNPCAEQSEGVVVCNGTDQEVISPPADGGPWRLVYRPGHGWDWENAGGGPVPPVETVPEPRPAPEGR